MTKRYHIYKDSWYCFGAQTNAPEAYPTVEFTEAEYEYYETALDYQQGLQNLLERKYKEQHGKTEEINGNT